uniref:Uncharacterized protein n=1 Tax=Rhabditophanes sp. KR3021 TaxID=114890 RepID=A0AC35TWG9_9BILA
MSSIKQFIHSELSKIITDYEKALIIAEIVAAAINFLTIIIVLITLVVVTLFLYKVHLITKKRNKRLREEEFRNYKRELDSSHLKQFANQAKGNTKESYFQEKVFPKNKFFQEQDIDLIEYQV